MLTRMLGFGVALATTAIATSEFEVQDFNTKLFWKRPEQGKCPYN